MLAYGAQVLALSLLNYVLAVGKGGQIRADLVGLSVRYEAICRNRRFLEVPVILEASSFWNEFDFGR